MYNGDDNGSDRLGWSLTGYIVNIRRINKEKIGRAPWKRLEFLNLFKNYFP